MAAAEGARSGWSRTERPQTEHSQDGTTGRPRGRRGFRWDSDPTAGATAAEQIEPGQQLREETPRQQHHRDATGQNCRRCSEHHAGSRDQCFHPALRCSVTALIG
ncbi:hypothetical protein F2P79_000221 [Pimephales promelas]|nr:hypothetical protein F2P79_000221 [Pimephales promelas]